MTSSTPILHMLCGKIASGKSTLAADLARAEGTVLIVEDDWLNALFGDQMSTVPDYVRCAAKLRAVMGPHVSNLLNSGLSVVLDFQANTVESRAWMRSILDGTEAGHRLHVLDVPDALCLARLGARNVRGDHPFAPTEAQFHAMARHYAPPTPDEGFDIVRHAEAGAPD
ncbi:MAG: ATP-binding protein [Pseudomonadota bacterium]